MANLSEEMFDPSFLKSNNNESWQLAEDNQDLIRGRFVVFDLTMSTLAIILNVFVFLGIVKAKLHLRGYRVFLMSLCLSDIYASIVNIGSNIVQVLSTKKALDPMIDPGQEDSSMQCWIHIFRSLQIASFTLNMLTLCAMSIDHFIGIVHPLKYNVLLSKRTVYCSVVSIWIFSLVFGFSDYVVVIIWRASFGTDRGRLDKDFISVGKERCSQNEHLPPELIDVFVKFLKEYTLPRQTTTNAYLDEIPSGDLALDEVSYFYGEIEPSLIPISLDPKPQFKFQTAATPKFFNSHGVSPPPLPPLPITNIGSGGQINEMVMDWCQIFMDDGFTMDIPDFSNNQNENLCAILSRGRGIWLEAIVLVSFTKKTFQF